MATQTDVLIVGAGPVGLFMANELLRHGVSCQLIDKNATTSTQSKALGIHIRTLEALQQTGLIDDVLAQGHRVQEACVFSRGKKIVALTFAPIHAPFNYLIDLPQNQTEEIFEKKLSEKGTPVTWKTELMAVEHTDVGVIARIKTAEGVEDSIHASWIIACDGAHSTLRHLCKLEFIGAPYPQQWWLADMYIDWQLPDNKMHVFLTQSGPIAAFPMNNQRYRLVMLAPQNGAEHPTLVDVQQHLATYCEVPATLRNPLWITGFTIHHRQIQQYRHERIFFCGDAAHIHSPLGGQGMNTGIQDAYNLAWKLALVQHGHASPLLLDSYHAERYPIGKKVLRGTDRMTRMLLLKNPLLISLRNRLMSCATSLSVIQKKLINTIAELSVAYHNSPIVNHHGYMALKAGTLLPYVHVMPQHGGRALSLFEIANGIQHHAFIFVRKDTQLANAVRLATVIHTDHAKQIAAHVIIAKNTPSMTFPGTVWLDPELKTHQQLKIKSAGVILVRPDQYIGYVQKTLEIKPLLAYLKGIFK